MEKGCVTSEMDYYFLRSPNRYRKNKAPSNHRSNYQDVIAGMKSGKYLSGEEWANLKFEKELLQIYRKKIKNGRK